MRTVFAMATAVVVLAGAGIPAPAGERLELYSRTGDAARYTRTYDGLRVYGGDVVVRRDGGRSDGLSAPLTLRTTPSVPAARARDAATAAFDGTASVTGTPELFVDASGGTGKLAWETIVTGWRPDGQTPSKLHVVVDAVTGAVTGSFDEIETVAGVGNSLYSGQVGVETTAVAGSYNLTDPAHGGGYTCDMANGTTGACALFTDADNVWGTGATADRASAAVDAHVGAAKTFDYFATVHGRAGIFGDGTGVPSRVHYGDAYVNAFWDGAQMTYGDGYGNAKPLVSLDIAGHEMSHGVTANVVPGGLLHTGEPGALNEATSDIFGTMVEFYADSPGDVPDYEIGEKLDLNGDGSSLRYLYDPALDGASHSCWTTVTKDTGVHFSSGVGNHFFFDLAEGTGTTAYGRSPVCGTAAAVTGIGRDKAAAIWFRALTDYFVSTTTYAAARTYTLAATADLYGRCGTEYQAVRAAWTAVNVAGTDSC